MGGVWLSGHRECNSLIVELLIKKWFLDALCWFVVVAAAVVVDVRFYYNSEYGSYRTKKQKQCLILKRSATISPIQTIGNPKEGELKLLYSPNIVLNKP